MHIPELIAETFGGSRSEARRVISQGGVKLDGEPITEMEIPAEDLNGELQLGRRRTATLVNGEVANAP